MYNRQIPSKLQLCSSYKFQIDSTFTLLGLVYRQVSSKIWQCLRYKCQFDSTPTTVYYKDLCTQTGIFHYINDNKLIILNKEASNQLWSRYKCQFDSTPTLQGPVHVRQVSSISQLCSSYKISVWFYTYIKRTCVYNRQVSSKGQLCSSYKNNVSLILARYLS